MKHLPVDMAVWQGRIDPEDGDRGLRLHQTINAYDPNAAQQPGIVIYGFACDEGVARNQGRLGAALAPDHATTSIGKPRLAQQPAAL